MRSWGYKVWGGVRVKGVKKNGKIVFRLPFSDIGKFKGEQKFGLIAAHVLPRGKGPRKLEAHPIAREKVSSADLISVQNKNLEL